MATPGRKPVPTRLKLLRGNPGKRPINDAEPTLPSIVKIPPAPAFLNDIARKEWRRRCADLLPTRVLTNVDLGTLAAYCSAYAEFAEANERIKITGMTAVSEKGTEYFHPLVAIRSAARKQLVQFAAEFGFTPSSRSRIKAPPPPKHADPEDPLDE